MMHLTLLLFCNIDYPSSLSVLLLIYLIYFFFLQLLIYLICTFFAYFCRLDQQTITSIIMIWEILAVQSMFSVGTGRLFHTWNFCLMMNLLLHQQIVHCDYGMWRKTYQWVIWAKWFLAIDWFLSHLSFIFHLICGPMLAFVNSTITNLPAF